MAQLGSNALASAVTAALDLVGRQALFSLTGSCFLVLLLVARLIKWSGVAFSVPAAGFFRVPGMPFSCPRLILPRKPHQMIVRHNMLPYVSYSFDGLDLVVI